MIRTFLILTLILFSSCTLTINNKDARPYRVNVPYKLHFKNNSSDQKPTIRIKNDQDSIIFETTSEQIEEKEQLGKFKTSGRYFVIVSFPVRKPVSETSTDFYVEGNEKRIVIGLNIDSKP